MDRPDERLQLRQPGLVTGRPPPGPLGPSTPTAPRRLPRDRLLCARQSTGTGAAHVLDEARRTRLMPRSRLCGSPAVVAAGTGSFAVWSLVAAGSCTVSRSRAADPETSAPLTLVGWASALGCPRPRPPPPQAGTRRTGFPDPGPSGPRTVQTTARRQTAPRSTRAPCFRRLLWY